jgi:hypothetical protein
MRRATLIVIPAAMLLAACEQDPVRPPTPQPGLGPLAPLTNVAAATANTETYVLVTPTPNRASAPNGDRLALLANGTFQVHPKAVDVTGTFTHTDAAGNVLGTGSFVATKLLSFQLYGCGIVRLPGGDVTLPPNVCGGKLMMEVLITSGGKQFEGILWVFCIIGANPPNSHDELAEEGVRLDIKGVINFNKVELGGTNAYIRTTP